MVKYKKLYFAAATEFVDSSGRYLVVRRYAGQYSAKEVPERLVRAHM